MNYTKSQYKKDLTAAMRLIKRREKETFTLIKKTLPKMAKFALKNDLANETELNDWGWLEETRYRLRHISEEEWNLNVKRLKIR